MSEHDEQAALIEWASYSLGKYPELVVLYSIPNGGKRNKVVAVKLKAEGVKSGVPDLHLPVARGIYHSLYIEMKYGKNKPTANQDLWAERLMGEGNKVVLCYSFEEARDEIVNYLMFGRII